MALTQINPALFAGATNTTAVIQSNGTTAITVDSSQNVGIGGAATNEGGYAKVLQITGSTDCALELKGGSSYSYVAQNGTTLQIRNNDASGNMTFSTNATERMRINSSGILLVNKTSTSSTNGAKVYVAGHFSQPTGTANTDGTTDAKNYGYGWCASASEDAMAGLLTSNLQGNWGMDLYLWLRNSGGGSLVNRFQVSNAGSCYNTTGTYGTISDINVKENVIPAPNYLNKLLQVEVVKYSLKEEHSDVPTKLGVVAQQVEQIFPNIVEQTNSSNEDGDLVPTKAVKYSVFVPMLIKAIQELKAELDTVKAELVALKGS